MKRMISLFLCAALLLSLPMVSLAEDATYAEAFSGSKSLTLVKAELPTIGLLYGWTPLSQSPDGKTMLWQGSDMNLYLTRDGLVIPVQAAPDKGAGDPYGKLEVDMKVLGGSFPSYEGVAWSPDGKYAALTLKVRAVQNARPMDLVVLDTETGEAYLAVALSNSFKDEHFGSVYEACFDHTGRYIYFLGRIRDMSEADSLFRFDMNTSEVQLVRENMFAVTAHSLFERADGTWMVLHTQDYSGKYPEAVSICGEAGMGDGALAIFRALTGSALPAGGAQQYTRLLPYSVWFTQRMLYSAASGYGLKLGSSQVANVVSSSAQTDPANSAIYSVLTAMCMSRITPETIDVDHYWRFVKENGVLRTEPVDDALVDSLQKAANIGMDSLTEAEQTALDEFGVALLRDPQPRATWGCLSPDGKYALLNVGGQRAYELCLLDLETMEVRPVNAPEGLAGAGYGSVLGAKYRPGMEWHADGMLLIYNNATNDVEAYRLEAN